MDYELDRLPLARASGSCLGKQFPGAASEQVLGQALAQSFCGFGRTTNDAVYAQRAIWR